MSTLVKYRRQKDLFLQTSPDSPFSEADRAIFNGLSYFPENAALRLTVSVEEFPVKDQVMMATSTGTLQPYIRWGQFHFEVAGSPATLVVYYASWGGYFLPFTDTTNGDETYATGRYLELEVLDDGTFLVDFNLAYNPYCAYSDSYSCPIPPEENRLAFAISAGEKRYR